MKTLAVDIDPLSLLCRIATSVPPPRFHTVMPPASAWRARIRSHPEPSAQLAESPADEPSSHSTAVVWKTIQESTYGGFGGMAAHLPRWFDRPSFSISRAGIFRSASSSRTPLQPW
jgi:hypothetical protein